MVKEIIELTESEARICAHVSADGCLSKYIRKRCPSDLRNHPRKNIYRTEYEVFYCNNDQTLLENYLLDVKKAYGLKAFRNGNSLKFKAKWVFERLAGLGAGKSREWFISREIMGSNKKIIREWLKAFFDDEAYVEVKKSRIVLNNVNLNGLKQVQKLLKRFDIQNTTIRGPYYTRGFPCYRLKVLKKDVKKYRVKIGFTHQKKLSALNEIVDCRALKL